MVADLGLRMSFFGGGRRGGRDGGGGLGLVIALVAIIVAPIAATIIRLAVSRQREYLADASGAMLTRYPDGLAGALDKIRKDSTAMPHTHTATAHLFIGSPLNEDDKDEPSYLAKLFMTHPPLSERIARLRQGGSLS